MSCQFKFSWIFMWGPVTGSCTCDNQVPSCVQICSGWYRCWHRDHWENAVDHTTAPAIQSWYVLIGGPETATGVSQISILFVTEVFLLQFDKSGEYVRLQPKKYGSSRPCLQLIEHIWQAMIMKYSPRLQQHQPINSSNPKRPWRPPRHTQTPKQIGQVGSSSDVCRTGARVFQPGGPWQWKFTGTPRVKSTPCFLHQTCWGQKQFWSKKKLSVPCPPQNGLPYVEILRWGPLPVAPRRACQPSRPWGSGLSLGQHFGLWKKRQSQGTIIGIYLI